MENAKMKFCGTCGTSMPETAQFCPKCGGKAPETPGQPVVQNDAAATAGIPSFGGTGFAQTQTTPQTDLGMNWYKFIIYFALFANALLLVINSISLFTGGSYGENAEYYYELLGGLRAFDIFFGLVFLVMAAMAIYVRQKLANFTRDAPRLLYALIIAINVANVIRVWGAVLLIYSAMSSMMLGSFYVEYMMDPVISTAIFTTIGSIVACAIWLGVNYVYFNKRTHLFVN